MYYNKFSSYLRTLLITIFLLTKLTKLRRRDMIMKSEQRILEIYLSMISMHSPRITILNYEWQEHLLSLFPSASSFYFSFKSLQIKKKKKYEKLILLWWILSWSFSLAIKEIIILSLPSYRAYSPVQFSTDSRGCWKQRIYKQI